MKSLITSLLLMLLGGGVMGQSKKDHKPVHFKYVDTAYVYDTKIRCIIGRKSFIINRKRNWQIDSANVVNDFTKLNPIKYNRIDTLIIH